MTVIVIDLQDGFADDEVLIQAEGQEIFNEKGVNTDYSIGLAASVKFEVSEKNLIVEVTVPSRRISNSIKVDVSSTSYLGVSILDNEINYQFSDEEFIYF
jgi:hypothetical protein